MVPTQLPLTFGTGCPGFPGFGVGVGVGVGVVGVDDEDEPPLPQLTFNATARNSADRKATVEPCRRAKGSLPGKDNSGALADNANAPV